MYGAGDGYGDRHPMAEDGWAVAMGWTTLAMSEGNVTSEWTYDPGTMDYFFTRYLQAFFDAVTDQLVEKANNDSELVVGILAHFFYECLYGFVLGTLTSMVMESRKSRQEYDEKITTVREFCIANNLGPEISTPVLRFFRHLYPVRKTPSWPRSWANSSLF